MTKEIVLGNRKIQYSLQYKKVKNINLRIKKDATVSVSANRAVPKQFIEQFIKSKENFILKALEQIEKREEKPSIQYFSEEEIKKIIPELCLKVYPYFKERGIKYPQIKFRKMVSQWGNCCSDKGVLTFNTNLMYAPLECLEYVVLHEFTHFLVPNHSNSFYAELSVVCPMWRDKRKMLREVSIR